MSIQVVAKAQNDYYNMSIHVMVAILKTITL